jgi:hypothetical protein
VGSRSVGMQNWHTKESETSIDDDVVPTSHPLHYNADAVRQAEAGRSAGLAGCEHGRRHPSDRYQRSGLRDEFLNGEIFYTLREAQIIIESWRRHYNGRLPSCLSPIQTTSTRGLRARICRVAGFATSTGSAGHAGKTASSELTFDPDHSMWAAQSITLQMSAFEGKADITSASQQCPRMTQNELKSAR